MLFRSAPFHTEFFLQNTLSQLRFFHFGLILFSTISKLQTSHQGYLSSCILSVLHSVHVPLFNVALFSYSSFFTLFFSCYTFSIAIYGCFIILIKDIYGTVFLLHLFYVAIFSCSTLFMLYLFILNFFHVALLSCCTLHK